MVEGEDRSTDNQYNRPNQPWPGPPPPPLDHQALWQRPIRPKADRWDEFIPRSTLLPIPLVGGDPLGLDARPRGIARRGTRSPRAHRDRGDRGRLESPV